MSKTMIWKECSLPVPFPNQLSPDERREMQLKQWYLYLPDADVISQSLIWTCLALTVTCRVTFIAPLGIESGSIEARRVWESGNSANYTYPVSIQWLIPPGDEFADNGNDAVIWRRHVSTSARQAASQRIPCRSSKVNAVELQLRFLYCVQMVPLWMGQFNAVDVCNNFNAWGTEA